MLVHHNKQGRLTLTLTLRPIVDNGVSYNQTVAIVDHSYSGPSRVRAIKVSTIKPSSITSDNCYVPTALPDDNQSGSEQ